MRYLALLLPLLGGLNGFAQTTRTSVTVTRNPAPRKALVFEVRIPATLADLWQAFTTSEGLSTWLTPGAVVDLRAGGEWTAHYPGGKTGGGTIVSFVPQREIGRPAMPPQQLPTVRAERTMARFQFVPAGESTLVRLTQIGWKTGKEWDDAYEYLASGNVQLLDVLRRRFIEGPIDWGKEW